MHERCRVSLKFFRTLAFVTEHPVQSNKFCLKFIVGCWYFSDIIKLLNSNEGKILFRIPHCFCGINIKAGVQKLSDVSDDPDLLERITTRDHIWVYGEGIETKAQSSQWKFSEETKLAMHKKCFYVYPHLTNHWSTPSDHLWIKKR